MMKKADIEVNRKTIFVLDTGATELKVKKVLFDDLVKGVNRSETDKKVGKIVDDFAKAIKSPSVKNHFLNSIAESYKRWYGVYSLSVLALFNFKKTNERLVRVANTKGFLGVDFDFNARNYLGGNGVSTVEVKNYKKTFKEGLAKIAKDFSKEEFKGTSGGTLRNFAEIKVRAEENKEDVERMKSEGINLVWASSHANASPRCAPWQGKLYSLDGTNGRASGINFEPLENATRGKNNDGNGLLGYNCRHRLIPYFEGSTPPKDFTKEEVEREYAIDLEQRKREREIRQTKEQAHLLRGIDNEHSKALFEKAREATREYREFSNENGRAAYVYRTEVSRTEIARNKELRESEVRGIIGVESVDCVAITNISSHAQMRMSTREVPRYMIIDAIRNPMHIKPDKVDGKGRISRVYIGERATVYINPITGNIASIHLTGEERRRKYGKIKNP